MRARLSAALASAFFTACADELQAPKPGNVHIFAAGHGMEAQDFLDSATVAAPLLAAPDATPGARILASVEATFARVGQNTNLGIILLCAPLAHAALNFPGEELRAALKQVLRDLTREDAELAFKAIARANPGGLGSAPQHDVSGPAEISLLAAMQAAAARDRIAYQYAQDYIDIFGLGLSALAAARRAGANRSTATLRVYLAFLGAFPDSHVVRKFGPAAVAALRAEARDFTASHERLRSEEELRDAALAWDRSLKARGLNPGTSADLTVATLFADYAVGALANACKNG